MAIKYADEIVKEIEERDTITIPDDCVTGEEFEKWMYENEEVFQFESKQMINKLKNFKPE